jgi:hypothetical protein
MPYVFSLDGFRVDVTRARNTDTDIASAALVDAVKHTIVPTLTRDVGDVDRTVQNGERTIGLLLGPAEIDGPSGFCYSITNSGYDRSDDQTGRHRLPRGRRGGRRSPGWGRWGRDRSSRGGPCWRTWSSYSTRLSSRIATAQLRSTVLR